MALGFRRPIPRQGPPKTGAGLPLAVDTQASANPDVIGVGEPVFPPAPTFPPGYQYSPINKALTWLINALQLRDSTIPKSLGVRCVTPTVDIAGYAGWGLAIYSTIIPTLTPFGGNPEAWWMFAPDPLNTQILVAFSFTNSNAQALNGQLWLVPSSSPTAGAATPGTNFANAFVASVVSVANFIVPAGNGLQTVDSQVSLNTLIGPERFIVCPPGYGLVFAAASGGWNAQNPIYIVATIPGNFGAGR